jgi:hypothetical protein
VILVVPTARSQCAGRLSRRARGCHHHPQLTQHSSASLTFHRTKPVPSSNPPQSRPTSLPSPSADLRGALSSSWQAMHPVRLIDAPCLLGASHLAPQHMLYMLRLAWYPPGAQAPGAACNGSTGENDGPRGPGHHCCSHIFMIMHPRTPLRNPKTHAPSSPTQQRANPLPSPL